MIKTNKIIISTLIVLGLSVSAYADVSQKIKQQCQYVVYGNGVNSNDTDSYMIGIIDGSMYNTPLKELTKVAKNGTFGSMMEVACKEALANNSTSDFSRKYKWGVAVVINRTYAQNSNLD